jgi:hypothetical protein
MKIRKPKWNNDPVLDDLFIDVSKNSTILYETIVFAGDNGSG